MDEIFIHPSACIDEGCIIGAKTSIWCFSHLMACTIGDDCTIGQNVFIDRSVVIGNRVKIQNNVSVFTGVICEDDVFIGPSVVFTNVINPRSFISRKDEFKNTRIKTGASLGANSTIICGITIGKYAAIGAGSVVTKHVPDYGLFYGNPARQKGWVSKNGHKLNFQNGKAQCPETGETYVQLNSNQINPEF